MGIQDYKKDRRKTAIKLNAKMHVECRVVQPVRRSYGMARHLKWRSLIEVLEV